MSEAVNPHFFTPARMLPAFGMTLLFLMLFVPTTYQPVKAVLLAVLLSAVGIALLQRNGAFRLHRSVAVWTMIITTAGVFFMLLGAANEAPGALRVWTVYLLWPVVFTILIGGLVNDTSIQKLLAVLVYSGIALGLYGAMYFGHALGWLPDALYVEINQGQIIGLYDGFVEYNMYSIATLLFLVPFLFAAILHWGRPGAPVVARHWLWLAYALCLALAILSGRRALWISLLLTPVIYWGVSLFSGSTQDSRSATLRTSSQLLLVSAAVFLLLKMIFGLELSVMAGRLVSSVSTPEISTPEISTPEISTTLRYEQAIALLSGWKESPWIGHGHGAVAQGSVRSTEMPWAYELTYLALLFHTGLLGTLIYAGCIAWIYWQGLGVARRSSAHGHLIIPVLVGLTSFLIANATNPYLAKFDFMWVIFLPLAIINRHLIERDSKGANKCLA